MMNTLKKILSEQTKSCTALVGLGGIGKTQVALQLAHWVMQERQPRSVIWIPAFSMAGFEKTCMDIVQKLGIQCANNKDPKEVIQQYLSSEKAKSWLLIVDNADNMGIMGLTSKKEKQKGIYQYLPRSNSGHVLFTTRSQEVAVSVAGRDVVELGKMSPDEARDLLERSLIHTDQLQDGRVLEKFLGRVVYLPLAITQAAAYINIKMITLAKYIEIFDGTKEDAISLLSNEVHDGVHYDDTQKAAATTWIISFRQIESTDRQAARLLSFISWIEPKGIPQSILPGQESNRKLTDAIGTLCGYRFLGRRGEEDVYDMHRLVHLAAKMWTQEEAEGVCKETPFRHLSSIFRTDKWDKRETWRAYLPHILRALEVGEGEKNEEYCKVGVWAGRCLRVDGRLREAVKLLEHVVAVRGKTLKENHPDQLASQHTLAIAYNVNGQVKEATQLLEHVVKVQKKTLKENHPDQLTSQHELAESYRAGGQTKKAIQLLEYVVATRKKTSKEDHLERLASQHALAMAYIDNGQVKKAIQLLEHVVVVREKMLEKDHPARLASQHTLAIAYHNNGQIKETIQLLEYVVAIQQKTLNEDHPDQLGSQFLLARAYYTNRQVKKAIQLLEYVVVVRKKTLEEDHPARLASQSMLARMYEDSQSLAIVL